MAGRKQMLVFTRDGDTMTIYVTDAIDVTTGPNMTISRGAVLTEARFAWLWSCQMDGIQPDVIERGVEAINEFLGTEEAA